jgi:hypothetical protein
MLRFMGVELGLPILREVHKLSVLKKREINVKRSHRMVKITEWKAS